MSKMRALLVGAAAAGAFTLGAVGSASAETITVPGVGTITTEGDASGGSVHADGTGPGPLSGYIWAGGSTSGGQVCADDNGSHGDSESPTCAP